MSAIGQAYPTISYIMVDQTDNMTRLYPQALLKQFTNLSVKPNWAYYDINAEFNSQVNWYFFNSSNPIRSDQIDLLRNVVHEFIHGLGFLSSWSDSFYAKLSPLVDGIDRFITPMLLTSVKESSATSYDAPQPFWGFVEFPFDKLIYANSSNALSPFTTVTYQLNQFYGSNVTFKSALDWANAWYASDAYKIASSAYSRTVSADNVLAVVNNVPTLLLETSLNPFSQGSSLCHVDQQTYVNSTEALMVYMADRGVSLNKTNRGPFGPKLIKVLAGLGYKINASFFNATTIRPELIYWMPPQGLVNTNQNPSPSLVSYTNGPAHAPITSTSSISVSHTSSCNHLIISSWLILLLLLFNVLMY
ncbi:hypothetical protein CU097_010947 [Rhizopus azygosporus]|uniref:Uncharacterized protein n=1 Tax=Rhizopus azygosporus TaxID=86630 RepID=A0A367JQT3_RHIAZ|nr:hypothetical protein CU097_010947 [Rhizopus azygosporus]